MIQDVVPGAPAGPRHEVRACLKNVGLVPERQCGILEYVLGGRPIGEEREYARVERRLGSRQQADEFIRISMHIMTLSVYMSARTKISRNLRTVGGSTARRYSCLM